MHIVGDYKILGHERLIVPEGMQAQFDMGVHGLLTADFDDNAEKKSELKITGHGNSAKITAVNWSNPLGQGLVEPIEVGRTNEGARVFLLFTARQVGTLKLVDLQLMSLSGSPPEAANTEG